MTVEGERWLGVLDLELGWRLRLAERGRVRRAAAAVAVPAARAGGSSDALSAAAKRHCHRSRSCSTRGPGHCRLAQRRISPSCSLRYHWYTLTLGLSLNHIQRFFTDSQSARWVLSGGPLYTTRRGICVATAEDTKHQIHCHMLAHQGAHFACCQYHRGPPTKFVLVTRH